MKSEKSAAREIVIYCEGFGAGPGGGWFVELSFVDLNHGGFSVFRRSDGTLDDEYPEDEDLSEDVFSEDGTWDVEDRARRIATIEKPLTWRLALRFARRLECIRIGRKDISKIRIRGVQPWQRTVITNVLARRAGAPKLSPLIALFSDEDLEALHSKLGGLLSRQATKVLTGLAEALRSAGIRRKSLLEIAELVGVTDPWELRSLTDAVNAAAAGRVHPNRLRQRPTS